LGEIQIKYMEPETIPTFDLSQALAALTTALALTTPLAVMEKLLATVWQHIPLDGLVFWQGGPQGIRSVLRYGILQEGFGGQFEGTPVPEHYFDALRATQVNFFDKVDENYFWYQFGIRTSASLVVEETPDRWSVVSLVCLAERRWRDDERHFLGLVRALLVQALERAHSESFFEALFRQGKDHKVVLDKNFRFVNANDAALALIGQSQHKNSDFYGLLIGETPWAMIVDHAREQFLEQVKGALAGSRLRSELETYILGQKAILHIDFTPIFDFSERVSHVLIKSQDITQERLRQEEIQEINKTQSEFLARLSHELRTPMAVIMGYAQLLELDGQDSEPTSNIIQASQHVIKMADELMKIVRLDAGYGTVVLEPTNIVAAINTVATMLMPLAQDAGVQIGFSPATEPIALGDPHYLNQVILNLVSNAIKYNRSGGQVNIAITEQADTCAIEVSDNGMGIDQLKIPHLFRPFERLGMENTTIKGVGLGLALTKRLVELMNGRIRVESRYGEGSTFRVELPLHQVNGSYSPEYLARR
jgi:PAS domain S-box-containing protein